MQESFAEVLARETTLLAAVSDVEGLDRWRLDLVDMAADPSSAYARVLRSTGDSHERAAFLDSWRDLIATAIARVATADPRRCAGPDPRRMAVSVLTALYGGAVMSRVLRDTDPLRISVELALAPLLLSLGASSIPNAGRDC